MTWQEGLAAALNSLSPTIDSLADMLYAVACITAFLVAVVREKGETTDMHNDDAQEDQPTTETPEASA